MRFVTRQASLREQVNSVRFSLVLGSFLAVSSMACGSGGGGTMDMSAQSAVTVGGAVTNGTPGSSTGFDRSDTVSSTTTIRAGTSGSSGEVSPIATTTLSTDGTYALTVPGGSGTIVIQALNPSGAVLASTVVDTTGQTNVTAPTMTVTSSVEANVFTQMVAQGMSSSSVNVAMLSGNITAAIAAAVKATADSGGNASAQIQALASAEISAQSMSSTSGSSTSGSSTSGSTSSGSTSSGSTSSGSTSSGSTSSGSTSSGSTTSGSSTSGSSNGTAQGTASPAASVSFVGTLQAELGSTLSNQALIEASILAQASIEAQQTVTAINATLQAASASESTMSAATSAGLTLEASVAASGSAQDASQAFATYAASIVGGAQVSMGSSVVGELLGVGASGGTSLQSGLQATLEASTQAQATLESSLSAAFGSQTTSPSATAQAVTNAYATFQATIQQQAQANLGSDTSSANLTATANLLSLALGSFQATAGAFAGN